jgi:hypothetical protein
MRTGAPLPLAALGRRPERKESNEITSEAFLDLERYEVVPGK